MKIKQTIISASLLAVIAFLAILPIISAQQDYNCPMSGFGGMMYGGYGSGFMILGWITYLAVLALIIAGVYLLIKSANKKK